MVALTNDFNGSFCIATGDANRFDLISRACFNDFEAIRVFSQIELIDNDQVMVFAVDSNCNYFLVVYNLDSRSLEKLNIKSISCPKRIKKVDDLWFVTQQSNMVIFNQTTQNSYTVSDTFDLLD